MTPVLIVGGGPVGLTLAALLARQGIACVVIEADPSYCTGSRAICLSRRSLEILDWCGAAESIIAKGLGWTSGRSYFRDEEVLHFHMPHDPTQRFAPMTNIQQFYVEQFVLEAAQARWPGLIDVRWNSRVTKLVQSEQSVTVELEHQGQYSQLSSAWLVACDGGRSTVRELMNLKLHGTTYEGRYVIVDIKQKSTRLQTQVVERLAWFDPPSNPGSTVLMHRQPDDVWRVDYQLQDHEDPDEAVKPENVLPRVREHLDWIGEVEPWEPLWISLYNAKCLTLDHYRYDRIMLAGDAAHLVPIFGVRGLNSGLDDAGNLAWKLSAVIKGNASTNLLDSYSRERRAATMVNLEYGRKSTEFMSPPHIGFDLLRKATLRLAASTPEVRSLINPRQSAPVQYPDYPADTQNASAGKVAPEALLRFRGKEQYLTEFSGGQFVVLYFTEQLTPPARMALDSAVRILFVERQNDPHGQAFSRYEAKDKTTILIRPDGYIAARWDSFDMTKINQAIQTQWCNNTGSSS